MERNKFQQLLVQSLQSDFVEMRSDFSEMRFADWSTDPFRHYAFIL